MKQKIIKLGIHEVYLVERKLPIIHIPYQADLINQLNLHKAINDAHYDDIKKNLIISYDASMIQYDYLEQVLDKFEVEIL